MNEPLIPFGVDRNGRIVFLSDLDEREYGRRCDLTCPECGKPLQAVRRLSSGETWRCLRHDDATSCNGYGESTAHLLCKTILSQSIGKTIMLPTVTAREAIPHVSNRTDHGRVRSVDDEVPDLVAIEPMEATLTGVQVEPMLECGQRPDLMLTLQVGGRKFDVAYEVRYTHAKSLQDVARFAGAGIPVLECLIEDISLEGEDMRERFQTRLLGMDGVLEWLYVPSTRTLIDRKYILAVHAEPEKLWTDVIRPNLGSWAADVRDDVALDNAIGNVASVFDDGWSVDVAVVPRIDDGRFASVYLKPCWVSGEIREVCERAGELVMLFEEPCWKCGDNIVTWRTSESECFPRAGRPRVEERYRNMILDASVVDRRNMAVFADRYSKTAGGTYRAFCCPHCRVIQGDFYRLHEPHEAVAVLASGVRPVERAGGSLCGEVEAVDFMSVDDMIGRLVGFR